jgi:hypothetical protein
VKVPGAKRSLKLQSFSTTKRLVEFLPSKFEIKFKNDGNVHLVPSGNIFLLRGKKQVGVIAVNEEKGNILPGTNRIYSTEWLDGYPLRVQSVESGKLKTDRHNEVVYHLDWDVHGKNPLSRIRIGKYTAHLFAVYDDGTRDVPIESEITFWVMPWRALLIVLAVMLVIGFGIWSAMRGVWKGARRMKGGRR